MDASQPVGNGVLHGVCYRNASPHIEVQFGVHVIWDAAGTIDLATATGAYFAWEVFMGAYASDYGLWNTRSSDYVRDAAQLGCRATLPSGDTYLRCRRSFVF